MEKIKKIIIYTAEIVTVVWAIHGMLLNYRICAEQNRFNSVLCADYTYPDSLVFAYFLSSILILYLLQQYKK
ncbi:MAG: hypothetical protein Q7S49_00415 [bacterium]|nr:hypothetical protein [bacterium]